MINKKALAILLISTIVVSGIVALDLREYEDYQVPRYASGTSQGDSIYTVYQDYRHLYASVAMVEWNTSSGTASSKIVVEGGWDHIRPKVFTHGQDLILGWIELHEEGEKFGYARYDTETETIGEKAAIDVTADPYSTDFSFEGTNFTVANSEGGVVLLWSIDVTTGESSHWTLDHDGNVGALSVNGSTLYYCIYDRGDKRIERYEDGQVTVLSNASNYVREVAGYGEYVAWIETTPGENWGRVRFVGESGIASFTVEEYAQNVDIVEHQGNIYVSWDEELMEEDDNDWAMEVRVAKISNVTDPKFTKLGEASTVDGMFSSNQFMVEHQNNLHVIWIDREGGYSLWSARIHESTVSPGKEIMRNGEIHLAIIMVLAMGVVMAPMIGFISLIHKGAPKKPGRKRADLRFLAYNRRDSYLFLKFYFAIVPFLFLLGIFLNIMLDPGKNLGFRIGYGSVINNCIAIIVSLAVLVMLRTEAKVSQHHRIGYTMLQASFIIALLGLLCYEFSKDAYSPYTIYVVYGTGLLAPMLAMVGPMVILLALTQKKAFVIPILPFLVVLALTFIDFSSYSSAVLFPSIASPARLISQSSLMINLMTTMMAGMLLAMTLFDSLTLESVKSISEWTKRDLYSVRNKALGMGLLMAGAVTIFSVYTASIIFIPDVEFLLANSFMVVMMLVVAFLIVTITLPMYRGDFYSSKFKESPSKAMYTIYCQPIMILIAMMVFSLMLGVFGLLVMAIYAYAMYKSDRMFKDMSTEALKDAAELEEIGEEEEKLEQITRKDVGFLVRRNLKYLIFMPPVVAMILLPIWKLNIVLPQMRAILPQGSIFVDIGIILICSLMFIEIWYARRKMSKAKELMDFVGLSSGGGGIVFPVVVMFFYTVGGGNLPTLLILVAMIQLNAILYITVIYPPLLKKLNREDEAFYMVPETHLPYLKVLKKSDETLFAIPGEVEDEAEPGTVAEGASGEVVAEEGKGVLVSVESPEWLELRIKDMKNKGDKVGILGVVIAGFGLVILAFIGSYFMASLIGIMFPVLGLLLVFLGLYVRKMSEKLAPLVVYENGIDITLPGTEAVFHPYEGFLTAIPKKMGGKDVLVLRGAMAVHNIFVWPEIEEFVKTIPEKVGKDPDKMPVGAGYRTDNVEKIRKVLVPISLSVGFLFSLMMAAMMGTFLDPLPAALTAFPVLTMVTYTFLISSQNSMAKRFKKPYNINRKHTTALFAICIVVTLFSALLFSQTGVSLPPTILQMNVDDLVDATIWDTNMQNLVLTLDEWLIIDGDIGVTNCTLNFDCEILGDFGLIITEGSNVRITDSHLAADSPGLGFKFEIKGPTTIRNTEIINVFGDVEHENGNGGVEVYADSTFINTTIDGSLTNGALVHGCTLEVQNCLIKNTDDEGIEVSSGELIIDNSTLDRCVWGIDLLYKGKATITNCHLENCTYAVTAAPGCEAHVSDTMICNSAERGIMAYSGSEITTSGVTYENNGVNYEERTNMEAVFCCIGLPLTVVIVCYGIVMYMARKQVPEKVQ